MATLTPEQRIKWLILIQEDVVDLGKDPTAETIESTYNERRDRLQDARYEVRCCGHYECEEVAAQCPDGKWVGWTYWHEGARAAVLIIAALCLLCGMASLYAH